MSMLQLPQWETKITIQECFDLELIYYLPDTKVVRSSQNVLNYSFIPLVDCFEFRICLAGGCLCSQNINKYSNKPAKGKKEWFKDFKKIWHL